MTRLAKEYRESLLQDLQDPDEAAAYLSAALEEGDRPVLDLASRDVATAWSVVYEHGPTSVGAWVPALPGCVAVGAPLADVQQLITVALAVHLRGMREDGDLLSSLTPGD